MRSDGWSRVSGDHSPVPRPGRRTFLAVGAGCAVPLLVGGSLATTAGGRADVAGRQGPDPILDHVRLELLRTYHAVRGPGGIRGEHIRTVATNLALIGAHLQGRDGGRSLDSVLRRRLRERGQPAVLQELADKWCEQRAGFAERFGIVLAEDVDASQASASLDRLAAHGVVASLRGHRGAMFKLAAWIDERRMVPGVVPVSIAMGQKPGDDFLGYPDLPAVSGSWCVLVTVMIDVLQLCVALAGIGAAPESLPEVVVAIAALQTAKDVMCDMLQAP